MKAFRVGGLFLGEDHVFVRDAVILVDDGIIRSVIPSSQWSKHYTDRRHYVAIPGLYNAHTHVFDYAFQEAGAELGLEEVVAPGTGLKHRMLEAYPRSLLLEAAGKALSLMASAGIVGVLDFREGGLEGCILAKHVRNPGIHYLAYCRPSPGLGDLNEIADTGDGLGIPSPLAYPREHLRRIRRTAEERGLMIHVHVSETPRDHSSKDYLLAVKELGADVLVHATNMEKHELGEIAGHIKGIVVCPRSNMWWSQRLPPIPEIVEEGITLGLGTDNLGWVKPDMWREMEIVLSLLRTRRRGPRDPSLVLKMATLYSARLMGLERRGVIDEGWHADIVLLDPEILGLGWSKNPLLTVVKRGGPEAVVETYVDGRVVYSNLSITP